MNDYHSMPSEENGDSATKAEACKDAANKLFNGMHRYISVILLHNDNFNS